MPCPNPWALGLAPLLQLRAKPGAKGLQQAPAHYGQAPGRPFPWQSSSGRRSRKVACVLLAKQNWPCRGGRGSAPGEQPPFQLFRLGSRYGLGGSHGLMGPPREADGPPVQGLGLLRVKDLDYRTNNTQGSLLSSQSMPSPAPCHPPPHRWEGQAPKPRRSGFPSDSPVSCFVPRESSAAAPTSGGQEKVSVVRATAGSQPGIWGNQWGQRPEGLGAEVGNWVCRWGPGSL